MKHTIKMLNGRISPLSVIDSDEISIGTMNSVEAMTLGHMIAIFCTGDVGVSFIPTETVNGKWRSDFTNASDFFSRVVRCLTF